MLVLLVSACRMAACPGQLCRTEVTLTLNSSSIFDDIEAQPRLSVGPAADLRAAVVSLKPVSIAVAHPWVSFLECTAEFGKKRLHLHTPSEPRRRRRRRRCVRRGSTDGARRAAVDRRLRPPRRGPPRLRGARRCRRAVRGSAAADGGRRRGLLSSGDDARGREPLARAVGAGARVLHDSRRHDDRVDRDARDHGGLRRRRRRASSG